MEVAGQWRRQWAGSAEYGKVIEGGVTRNVARAMEVLQASAPGAHVRVLRAAYHSSAGPGAPAASYLMHSSRQVISSGYNFLRPSSMSSKPLEISSTPFPESSPESEIENYKVTEPDDYEISEPSKWRGSSGKNSIRMPSEESSSADNASIIDLDAKTGTLNNFKKSNLNRHISQNKSRNHVINARVSPLLDAPVALSTLKYTSILNSSDEWNNRRKSYSFEDTSPLDRNISPRTNSFIMDSSLDSGICKSTEIVNDPLSSLISVKDVTSSDKHNSDHDESFKDWLSRNRPNFCHHRETSATPPRIYHKSESQENEAKIILQPSGKVSITLPLDCSKNRQTGKSVFIDENDRRTKKVEFCKTELHFAVDTGTVNIIATDEKPPPSNDFRRRRSAFVPLNNKIERSITLFGEKSEFSEVKTEQSVSNNEFGESDENTAATKGILKNRIPKPKPYLLGENMVFGNSNVDTNSPNLDSNLIRTSAVSLINNQFQSERRCSNETYCSALNASDSITVQNNSYRTGNKGPQQLRGDRCQQNNGSIEILETLPVKKSTGILPISSELNKTKIRELKGSDLAYFGIERKENSNFKTQSQNNLREEIFQSVKLVQKVSNSVCNSEAESDDAPEYQNIPLKLNFCKTPTPNTRSKDNKEMRKTSEPRILKPISEQNIDQDVLTGLKKKSLKGSSLYTTNQRGAESRKMLKDNQCMQKELKYNVESNSISSGKSGNNSLKRVKSNKENETSSFSLETTRDKKKLESPLYVNINVKTRKEKQSPLEVTNQKKVGIQNHIIKIDLKTKKQGADSNNISPVQKGFPNTPKENTSIEIRDKKLGTKQESLLQKKSTPKRTEKLTTPDLVKEAPRSVKMDSTNKNNYRLKKQSNESLRKNKIQNSTRLIEDQNKVHMKRDTLTKEKNGILTATVRTTSPYDENKVNLKSHRHITSPTSLMVHSGNVDKTSENKLDKLTKAKRSKYVINYDDKNGTVSSICKIKSGPGTYKRKTIPTENKIQQESNTKNISLNKIALLQLPDRNWDRNKEDLSNRKRKSSEHVQRSCQLL